MTDLPEPVVAEVVVLTAELAEVASRLDALAERYGEGWLTSGAALVDALVACLAEGVGIEAG